MDIDSAERHLIAPACIAALDVVNLFLLRVYRLRPLRHRAVELFFRLAGSLWLLWLQTCHSVRSRFLVRCIGADPWRIGWERLWCSPVLYICVRARLARSRVGSLVYVSETDCFHRRCREHVLRLLLPTGYTQQPFYTVVRRSHADNFDLAATVSQWIFLPVSAAPLNAGDRKESERSLIAAIGTLNPPRVYAVQRLLGRKRCQFDQCRLFESSRPLKRLRGRATSPEASVVRCARPSVPNSDLQRIAACLAGHKCSGKQQISRAAWCLGPRAWTYVCSRVDHEEGWRRRRAMQLLRLIARKRRDLVWPISTVRFSLAWTGSTSDKLLIRRAVLKLISQWRASGYFVPVLRHARFAFSWSRTPAIREVLSTSSTFTALLCNDCPPSCSCAERLAAGESWSCVTYEGQLHIASAQGRVPWPDSLRHLARWPASLTLPPRKDDIIASLRDCFRTLRRSCRVRNDGFLIEELVLRTTAQTWPGVAKRTQCCPVQWSAMAEAKRFLHGFFVHVFDHNLARLSIICPRLAWAHARKALNLGGADGVGANFEWLPNFTVADAVKLMCTIPALPSELGPARISRLSRRLWDVGVPTFLPKWKAPGLKWRLVINKRATPCNDLYSLICRAIDVTLDHFPMRAMEGLRLSITICC